MDDNELAQRRRLARVFVPFAAGYYLSYLYRTVNAVISSDLTGAFSLQASDLGLLTSTFFLTFAAFQLPLGVLLDRYGPRRVEAVLLLIAGAGALWFARGAGLSDLLLGRGLIGLGVSACLMASFKAFSLWFPRSQLPMINGWVMAAGGLGALTATVPVEILLGVTDWRGLFVGLAVVTFAAAALIYGVVPEPPDHRSTEDLRSQIQGVIKVFRHPLFWRLAPLTTVSQATSLSVQGLWAGPWLYDVAALDRGGVAGVLLLMACAMVAGFLSLGALAYRLSRVGVPPLAVTVGGMVAFMVAQVLMLLGPSWPVVPRWMLFGFFGTTGILAYAVLSQHFDARLAGRVNAAVNLLVFVGAFAAQWGVGLVVGLFPGEQPGRYAQAGYNTAFALLLMLQVMALTWFWLAPRKQRRKTS